MNLIESLQKKYIPGFYQSRYQARKTMALALKEKCMQHPNQLTLYELKIVLKVLQQFKLLPKNKLLDEKERNLKIKIVQNSIPATIAALLPFAVREFHGWRFVGRFMTVGVIFCGVDGLLMRPDFQDYIGECRLTAQRNIDKLLEQTEIP